MSAQLQQLRVQLNPIISQLPPILQTTQALATFAAMAVIGFLGTLRGLFKDYSSWKALGQGGLPHDLRGYIINLILRPLGAWDKTSIKPYASMQSISLLESTSFLGTKSGVDATDLSQRAGKRPAVTHHLVPSRQIEAKGSKARFETLVDKMKALAKEDPNILYFGDSVLERGGPALFLQSQQLEHGAWHTRTGLQPNEVAHAHRTDGSCHAFLSSADAIKVLEKGWGERHPLSGKPLLGKGLPANYLMLYAPRDDKELDTVFELIKASVRYAAEWKSIV